MSSALDVSMLTSIAKINEDMKVLMKSLTMKLRSLEEGDAPPTAGHVQTLAFDGWDADIEFEEAATETRVEDDMREVVAGGVETGEAVQEVEVEVVEVVEVVEAETGEAVQEVEVMEVEVAGGTEAGREAEESAAETEVEEEEGGSNGVVGKAPDTTEADLAAIAGILMQPETDAEQGANESAVAANAAAAAPTVAAEGERLTDDVNDVTAGERLTDDVNDVTATELRGSDHTPSDDGEVQEAEQAAIESAIAANGPAAAPTVAAEGARLDDDDIVSETELFGSDDALSDDEESSLSLSQVHRLKKRHRAKEAHVDAAEPPPKRQTTLVDGCTRLRQQQRQDYTEPPLVPKSCLAAYLRHFKNGGTEAQWKVINKARKKTEKERRERRANGGTNEEWKAIQKERKKKNAERQVAFAHDLEMLERRSDSSDAEEETNGAAE